MKSRDYGVAPISGKSSCGLDEFQSVISVKPIKEQRRSSFKDVFHGSSIFSALTRNETEKENVQTPLSSRKGVTSNGSSKTPHRSRHRGILFFHLFRSCPEMKGCIHVADECWRRFILVT